MHGMRNKK